MGGKPSKDQFDQNESPWMETMTAGRKGAAADGGYLLQQLPVPLRGLLDQVPHRPALLTGDHHTCLSERHRHLHLHPKRRPAAQRRCSSVMELRAGRGRREGRRPNRNKSSESPLQAPRVPILLLREQSLGLRPPRSGSGTFSALSGVSRLPPKNS